MSNPFDATASMIGYLYQCRLALVDSLGRARKDGSFSVSIETLDDVVFDTDGAPKELLQLKHHLNSRANLTNASPDLWKSVRIWAEGTMKERWADDTVFYLVTTEQTAEDTIAQKLEPGPGRDEDAAHQLMADVANESNSDTNRKGYQAFLALKEVEQRRLVSRIVVVARSGTLFDVEAELRKQVAHATKPELRSSFAERLEGWWFRRVIEHLRRGPASNSDDLDDCPAGAIRSEELDAKLHELRQAFRDDSLPVDEDIENTAIEDIDEDTYLDQMFVRQLKLIGVRRQRLLRAMLNFYRASTQRSRWLREGFLLKGELQRYEQRLVEEWEIRFEEMCEDLGEDAAEVAMNAAAKRLYRWASVDVDAKIRPGVDALFLPRGSLQMLADELSVGWHPHFEERLIKSSGGTTT